MRDLHAGPHGGRLARCGSAERRRMCPLAASCPPLLAPLRRSIPAGHLSHSPQGFSALHRPDVTFSCGGLLFPVHSLLLSGALACGGGPSWLAASRVPPSPAAAAAQAKPHHALLWSSSSARSDQPLFHRVLHVHQGENRLMAPAASMPAQRQRPTPSTCRRMCLLVLSQPMRLEPYCTARPRCPNHLP